MKFKILGSAGAIPTPRSFSNDWLSIASYNDVSLQRTSSCFWIDDINGLIDCPESIGESSNKAHITNIEYLFITHWHPDHCFGLRTVLESKFDFYTRETQSPIHLYIPQKVYEDIKKVYPSIDFFLYTKKCAVLHFLEHQESIEIHGLQITALGYTGEISDIYAYQISKDNKKLLYMPCDTLHMDQDISGLDVLVHECGIFSHEIVKHEIAFPALIDRLKKFSPKKTIMTHIEHIEIEKRGLGYLDDMKKQYYDVNFEFGYDGMEIEL